MEVELRKARAAGLVGIAATSLLSFVIPTVPAVGMFVGFIVIAGLLLTRRGGRKRYAQAGTIFFLGLGIALFLLPAPEAYATSVVPSVIFFGALSLLVVALKAAGRFLVKNTVGKVFDEEYSTAIYDAASSLAALLVLGWTILTFSEKILRNGTVALGGTATLALNTLGVSYMIPLFIVAHQVDVVLFLFSGFLLLGFYSLESLHTMWHATKHTAEKSVEAGKTAKAKADEYRASDDSAET